MFPSVVRIKFSRSLLMDASEWEDLHPGRCKHLQLPCPSSSTLSVSVCVLDGPSHLEASRPFAAILVPRGQEVDWIFCKPNGLWDLLFSAAVSRLVILRRLTQQHNNNEEKQQEHHQAEEQRGGLCAHPLVQPNLRETALPGTSQPYICPDYVDVDDDDDDASFKKIIAPVLHSLFPWSLCPRGPPSDPYVTYEDDVRSRHIVEICHSEALGSDILVEDVELDCSSDEDTTGMGVESNKCRSSLRRRMRFEQMPNLIQTEVPIAIYKNGLLDLTHKLEDVKVRQGSQVELEVRPDNSRLVHKYLPPIVAGLVLASPCLEACIEANKRARFLAIGLGGGALPLFLHRRFGFSVVAVDTDEIVVDLARRHFGLVDSERLQVHIEDGIGVVFSIAHQACRNNFISIEMLKEWQEASKDSAQELYQSKILSAYDCIDARVHVIVVDVNVADARSGLLSPPPCFLTRAFLLAVQMALLEGGMLVMNVIPRVKQNLNVVVNSLRKVFSGIYQIRIDDNYVLFAFSSKIADINMSSSFALDVAQAIGGDLFDHIEEVGESL